MDKQVNINISSGTIIKTVAILVGLWFLFYIRDIVLVVLTAIVIAAAVEPMANWFSQYKIPRMPAVILIYLLFAAFFVLIGILFIPTLISELSRLSSDLPRLLSDIDLTSFVPESIRPATTDFLSTISAEQVFGKISSFLSDLPRGIFGTLSFVFGGVFSFILILVLSFYLAVQKDGVENFLRVVVPFKYEKYALGLWDRTKRKIGLWLQGQLILALIIGVLVYLGLLLLQVKYALLLAVLAALFELIPIFGPILAAVPAVIVAFTGGLVPGFLVIGYYVIVQQFENHLIYPLVVTKIVGVPPLLVILALLVGGTVAGFLGFLLAIPASAMLIEIFHDIEREKLARHPKEE